MIISQKSSAGRLENHIFQRFRAFELEKITLVLDLAETRGNCCKGEIFQRIALMPVGKRVRIVAMPFVVLTEL